MVHLGFPSFGREITVSKYTLSSKHVPLAHMTVASYNTAIASYCQILKYLKQPLIN